MMIRAGEIFYEQFMIKCHYQIKYTCNSLHAITYRRGNINCRLHLM
jgi:hypothetical protein